MPQPRVLVVDDEPDMRQVCRTILEEKSYQVETFADGPEALDFLRKQAVDVIVLDLRLPSMNGLEVMREALRLNADAAVLLITAHAAVETAVQAVREGAFDFIPKPFSASQLEVAVERSISYRELVKTNRQLQSQLRDVQQFEKVVAHSWQMGEVLNLVRKVAPTEANVLLRGESGTGKELIARCLHQASNRGEGPFVPIDCAALPENLLESELFGHEKGSFTGAISTRPGLLETANGGTIFLDEIGNLSANLQAKLLRVLEDRKFRRVGGRATLSVDARFLSATNASLEDMIRQNTFREDLFYRLNVVGICLPPLRERPADIGPLAQLFLNQNPDSAAKGVHGISSAALMMLQSYRWPGNVRELKNVIWHAVSVTERNQIMPLDLPADYLNGVNHHSRPAGPFREAKQHAVEQFEASYLRQILSDTAGNVSQAARKAGIKRPALHRLLHKYKLDSSQFRSRR